MRGLYAIVDGAYIASHELNSRCEEALSAGCKIIQYRDKEANSQQRLQRATELCQLCQRYQACFIVNDDLALAKTLNCGVHLGGEDQGISEARALLGPEAIIGASCYNQLNLAQQACDHGASYIAFGAFFPSPTKPAAVVADSELLKAAQTFKRPIVAIGGITPDNGAALVTAGADMLAVISDLWQAADLPKQVQRYQQLFI